MTVFLDVRAIQTALRLAIATGAERVGPFLVTIDADAAGPFRNYAIPDDGAAPTATEIEALVAFFAATGRLPRLEFVAPALRVEQALTAAGFLVHNRLSLLALPDAAALRTMPLPGDITLDEPATDDRLRSLAEMQNAAYGEPGVNAADVARLRATLISGGAMVAARDAAGTTIAGGVLSVRGASAGGLGEIYGIATAAGHRRLGLGSAVAAALSRVAHDRDVRPYLQTEGPDERRMYEGIGYRAVGELVDLRGP